MLNFQTGDSFPEDSVVGADRTTRLPVLPVARMRPAAILLSLRPYGFPFHEAYRILTPREGERKLTETLILYSINFYYLQKDNKTNG
jgi:hypothetical protein